MSLPLKWILRVGVPIRRTLFIFVMCAACSIVVSAQSGDKSIAAIQRLTRQVNEQISESERIEESNGIYCNELVVNKENKSWPAVGIYRTVFRFYYTFGDREKNPYPNRLLKISVTTSRSDRREYAEYLFNPAGQLIFNYQKDGESLESDTRNYFAGERLIRRMTGQRIVDIRSRAALDAVNAARNEKKKLVEIFLMSLN